ncbi:MAG: two-component sensor histidine kinase [Geodermatophilaceae bacterium]|nr:two-component sensor histidine kinase [Geodermatophilaceae bacterium]
MDALIALAGFVAGVSLVFALVAVRRSAASEPPAPEVGFDVARRVVELMEPGAVVVDGADAVVLANAAARGLGVVRGRELAVPHLLRLVATVRRTGQRQEDVRLTAELLGAGPRTVGVQAMRLDNRGTVALLLLDVTESRRIEDVRRDFMANVSHELKTPVGALSLLAEAMQDAANDPDTIRRFSARAVHEAQRLNRLVRELIDLSRLQGGEPLPERDLVSVRVVIAEAIDRTRLAADARAIKLSISGEAAERVLGAEGQLVTALANLLSNAVAYSRSGTTVTVAARAQSGFAEIAVIDQGEGIPPGDQDRIFERFYRVDPARATATGGNGLGLAIVKHIATNHGGGVRVKSQLGTGSTFTLRIPLAPDQALQPRQTMEVR